MAFRLPRSGCLGTPLTPPPPPESVRTDGRTYAYVRTKIFRINGLPDLPTHGAPRAPLIYFFSTGETYYYELILIFLLWVVRSIFE